MNAVYAVDVGLQKIKAMLPASVVVEGKDVKFERWQKGGKQLVLSAKTHEMALSSAATEGLKKQCKFDVGMFRRLGDLQGDIFGLLMESVGTLRFVFGGDDGGVVYIDGEESVPDYMKIFENCVKFLKPKGITNLHRAGDRVSLAFVMDQLTEVPKREGEQIQSGVHVSMNGKIRLSEYNLTLFCTNGMTSAHYDRGISITDEEFEKILAVVSEDAGKFAMQYSTLTDHKLEDAAGVLSRLRGMKIIPSDILEKSLSGIASLGDEATAYDLVNHVTALQHNSKVGSDPMLLAVGGRMAQALSHKHCAKCGVVV